MLSYSDLKSLSTLLKVENESSSEDDLPQTSYTKMGPGDIGKKIKIRGNEVVSHKEVEINEDSKCIWSLTEVPEVPQSDDAVWDPREKPKYDIVYKQAVQSQDIFLQMTRKTASTASCECLKVTLSLEGEDKEAVDCDVSRLSLDVRSPRYRLHLPLPHPVQPQLSTAEWNPLTSQLTVTLQIDRELDFVNF